MAVVLTDAERLADYKKRIEKARTEKASLEGRRESLQEQAVKLKETMESEFGVKTLKALDKKIEKQEATVEKLLADLGKVFEKEEK